MNILAIDTAHQSCSLALIKNNQVAKTILDNESSKQAERLVIMMQEILSEFKISYNDLDVLAVNNGPGSFTGVRIGMSAAKGIKLVCPKINLMPVSSLAALAYNITQQKNEKTIVSTIDARRNQVFFQSFNKDGSEKSQACAVDIEKAYELIKNDDVIITGNGFTLIEESLNKNNIKFEFKTHEQEPMALYIAQIALVSFRNNSSIKSFIPDYIRQPDAKKSEN